jgi:hypothetical protein
MARRISRIDWVSESSVTKTPGQTVSISSDFGTTRPMLRARCVISANAFGRSSTVSAPRASTPFSRSSVKPPKRNSWSAETDTR